MVAAQPAKQRELWFGRRRRKAPSRRRQWSAAQMPLIDLYENPRRFILSCGAVGSGKTSAAIAGFVRWSLAYHEQMFGMVAKTTMQSSDVVLAEVRRFCREWKIPMDKDGSRKRLRVGTNLFRVFDSNDVTSIDRVQGYNLAGLYIDEVLNVPHQMMQEFDNRLRAVKSPKCVMTANPGSPAHWFKREWVDRADEVNLAQVHLMMDDNPTLSEEFKQSIKATSTGGFYNRRVLGQWAPLYGRIFPHYQMPAAPPPLELATNWFLSVDPADSGTTHALLIARFPDGAHWVIDEWHHDGTVSGQLTHAEQALRIYKWVWKRSIYLDWIVIDAAGSNMRRELSMRFRRRVVRAIKEVLPNIQILQHLLASGMVRMSSAVPELAIQLEGYEWDPRAQERGEDKPKRGRDHGVDALLYFARMNRWSQVDVSSIPVHWL